MADPSCTRRNVLRAGTTLAALGALSGCTGPLGGDGGNDADGSDGGDGTSSDAPRVDRVPASADAVVHVDVTRLLNDDRFRQRVTEIGEQSTPSYDVDVEAALDAVQESTGFDPRKASEVVAFGSYADASAGAIVWADWDETSVVEQFRASNQVQTTTHAGRTVYEATEVALAVTADGGFAVGRPDSVRAAVAVHSGDADAVSGTLREHYGAARSGYTRFAFGVPESFDLQQSEFSSTAGVLSEVTGGYGALYRGDSRGGSVVLETASADAAGDVADAAEGALSMAAMELANAERNEEPAATFEALVDATTVTRDGRTVTVTNDEGGGYLPLIAVAVITSFTLGLGSPQQPVAPTAAFAFDYSSADGTLETVHEAGDSIPASELSIRGENLGQTGSWAALGGSASGDGGSNPAIVAGDSLTLQASADYTVRVVWTSQEGNRSAVLAANDGPEA